MSKEFVFTGALIFPIAVGIAIFSILQLIVSINSLMAIDDSWEVLKKNWMTYTLLILVSIFYLLLGIGSIGVIYLASTTNEIKTARVVCQASI